MKLGKIMFKFEGTITPSKILSFIVFIGGEYVAIELDSVKIAIYTIIATVVLYLGRKYIAQLMMKYIDKHGTKKDALE